MSRFPRPGRTPRPRPVPTAGPTPSPTPGPGTTFTLTTNIETVPATGTLPANSTVNGTLANGTANGQTFQTGDTINGNATSVVNVNNVSDVAVANVVAINNIGNVNFRNLSSTAFTGTNAILWSGVGAFTSTQSLSSISLTNGSIATTYGVANSVPGVPDGIDISLRAGDLAGTSSTIKFSAQNAGSPAASASAAPTRSVFLSRGSGVEAISLATTGPNFVTVATRDGVATTDYASLVITGTGGDVALEAANTLAATSNINAAAVTGPLALNVRGSLSNGDTVTGGAATADVLQAELNGVSAVNLSVSGFEGFRIDTGTTTGTAAFATNPGFTSLRVDGTTAATQALRNLLNAGGFSAVNFVGAGTTASQAAATEFSGYTVSGGYAGTSDSVALNFSNRGAALGSGASYTVDNLITSSGVESYVVNVADATANTITTTLNGITDAATNSITVNTNGTVALGTVTGGSNALTSINFLGATGAATASSLTTGSNTLGVASLALAGTGGLSLTVAAEQSTDVLTFTGNTAADTLNASSFDGIALATGGNGNDTLTGGTNTDTLSGEAGNDSITGNAGNDVLRGGEGNDIIIGGNGSDTIDLGTGDDTVRYLGNNVTSLISAATDAITGFTAGAGSSDVVEFQDGLLAGGTGASSQFTSTSNTAAAGFTAVTTAFNYFNANLGATANNATSLAALFTAPAAAGNDFIVISQNGTDSFLWLASNTTDTTITAGELTLIGTVSGTTSWAQGDLLFIA